ncbi:hypothetical protein FDC62_11675 [Clostridium botulinum]|uniref:hypothetical protein n=1 Tax=Clostridium botulinum TaxID=1491 RepID=UPI00068D493C|nr:hypothetical protein [Clostridium botulinum]NFO98837.1 hypothetical protein [Clostridium botulinum]OOV53610.1 hypothetical protein B0673_12695 [Clostridium botulinum D/C]
MKKQSKIILAVVIAGIVGVGGYYGYQKHNLNKRIEASNKLVKDKGIKPSDVDKDIVDKILKSDNKLEHAYISHNGDTIMLNLKFKKGISDKDKYSRVSKYMDMLREKYKGKNVNTTIVPNK